MVCHYTQSELCVVRGCNDIVDDYYSPLGCDAVLIGSLLPPFLAKLAASIFRVVEEQ